MEPLKHEKLRDFLKRELEKIPSEKLEALPDLNIIDLDHLKDQIGSHTQTKSPKSSDMALYHRQCLYIFECKSVKNIEVEYGRLSDPKRRKPHKASVSYQDFLETRDISDSFDSFTLFKLYEFDFIRKIVDSASVITENFIYRNQGRRLQGLWSKKDGKVAVKFLILTDLDQQKTQQLNDAFKPELKKLNFRFLDNAENIQLISAQNLADLLN